MKFFAAAIIISLSCSSGLCQNSTIDSLNRLIALAKSDTARINLTLLSIRSIMEVNLDSAINLGYKTLEKSRQIKYEKGVAGSRLRIAQVLSSKGEYDSARFLLNKAAAYYFKANDSLGALNWYLATGTSYGIQTEYTIAIKYYKKAIRLGEYMHQTDALNTAYQNMAIGYQMQSDFFNASTYYQKALKLAEETNDLNSQAYIFLNLGLNYNSLGDDKKSEQNLLYAVNLSKKLGIKIVELYAYANLATVYEDWRDYQKSYNYAMMAVELAAQTGDAGMKASAMSRAALQLMNMKRFSEAEVLAKKSIPVADSSKQPFNIYQAYSYTAKVLQSEGRYAEAKAYYEKAFTAVSSSDIFDIQFAISYRDMSECYEKTGDFDKALQAYKKYSLIKDSVTSRENIRKATEQNLNAEFDKKQQVNKAQQEKKDELAKSKQTALIVGLALATVLLIVSFYAFQNKRKANNLLKQQNIKIESTLKELKTTQAQLVHSEKMASLGELTAGIAHEIQNPLNFVNNFSDVNRELITELVDEVDNKNYDAVKLLANDIKENEEKINHHGKRADSIVKGMLQHSRQTTGKKELTDINALCDEYLKLSYHGLRAKNKNFNTDFKTSFDESIGKVNIVPQDIGRVLINLFNNAFYAVNEKLTANASLLNETYKPLVCVETKRINSPSEKGHIEIMVSDNGNGIPQNIIDKIFQPFFTTKPTGQGTGLGLSLAYDIITKEHNGSIKAESKEGEGTKFIIILPA